ncbi:flagellar basal body P-ring formation chaperone FlgA [Silanimonas lenta]|uniref:flagellar basal body P-ring formation chaperone FlgA n=1 Tax=Silanimonas lenta TaxID=265429 RepID=UPI0003F7D076|nr:flagellar basal body P-ring formation chaperone FlgA [Silanimonas lenta]
MSRPEAFTPLPAPAPLPPPRLPPLPLPRRARRTLHLVAAVLALLLAGTAAGSGFQSVESIRAAAEAAIASPEARVEAHLDPALRMPACPEALQAHAVSAVNVEVACPSGWRLFVPVRVQRVQPVLVLAEALAPGQPIPASALRVETRDAARLGAAPLTDPAQAIGQVLRRGGRPGQVLTRADLVLAAAVKRGEPVSLVAGGGGFEVRMAGRALGDAATGEVVRVENLSSRRVLSGVVAGPGEVRVGR